MNKANNIHTNTHSYVCVRPIEEKKLNREKTVEAEEAEQEEKKPT